MPDYVAWYGATGRAGAGVSSTHEELLPPAPDGAEWVEIEGSCLDTTLALIDGARAEAPITLPASSALALARAERLAEAKVFRDARKAAGCLTSIGRVDTDDAAMTDLNSMAATAAGSIAAKTAFPIKTWTLANGIEAPLTATKGKDAQATVAAMRDACQQAYLAVKVAINAAADPAAIDITAGYPA